jgi:hypothetical protein
MLSLGTTNTARPILETKRAVPPAKVLTRSAVWPGRFTEALELPARLLPELPAPPSLGLHVPGVPGVVRVELDPDRALAARSEGELVIDASEWSALVVGAEADRTWSADLVAFCARKLSERAWRIEAETALAGAQPDPGESWTAARVIERLGAQVLSIELP